jgi:hypothetical protein
MNSRAHGALPLLLFTMVAKGLLDLKSKEGVCAIDLKKNVESENYS